MPRISELYIYPVKSLGGIALNNVQLTDRGFQYDRRWMLIDENRRFLSQREYPGMALLQSAIAEEGLRVFHKDQPTLQVTIPFDPMTNEKMEVEIWDDFCEGTHVSAEADRWFSEILGIQCRLVYMGDDSHRLVEEKYRRNEADIASFSDGYPVLMISQESLQDLNDRLEEALPMDRFRPNIVIEGVEPYEEDLMAEFTINGIIFFGVKPCTRCVMTTIDQGTGKKNKEPLRTLANYRGRNNKIYFGQNILMDSVGELRVGDEIEIRRRSERLVFDKSVE
jgi:uncharacterized protein YcbX